ncbi:hypothetical protein FisN_24Hh016 [Fistulifera solaris]|jgi:hypothetical protein|uniref:Uncharacterized protein n=1 Tax=Fistulifera solaris TaxID=1519565 RepID=A0A1Z5KJ83_FISSO|nr:hypothetical protein FisN_24Hh016 [Fistulifera solaris]|eukprot:GAX26111.1 hypothetical protein FisN_24Hh016 [Fistulifera solaris]
MLAADKLQLQSALKQQATALKEKEFQLHHSNLMTVGTQAAVLAGLDITMFIEFSPAPVSDWAEEHQQFARILRMVYYGIIVAAFCANMIVVSHTTALSVIGAGLALRGPDGSMLTATDGLYEERSSVFTTFGIGLACTVGSVLLSVWLMLPWESALICWLVALFTCRKIYLNYVRVVTRFDFDESQTVDFRDFLEMPALKFITPAQTAVQKVMGMGAVSPSTATSSWGFGRGMRKASSTSQVDDQHHLIAGQEFSDSEISLDQSSASGADMKRRKGRRPDNNDALMKIV